MSHLLESGMHTRRRPATIQPAISLPQPEPVDAPASLPEAASLEAEETIESLPAIEEAGSAGQVDDTSDEAWESSIAYSPYPDPATLTGPVEPSVVLADRPARSATKAKWLAYAQSLGVEATGADTISEIIAKVEGTSPSPAQELPAPTEEAA